MLTDYRRQDLERIKDVEQIKAELDNVDRDSLYPQLAGWLEAQQTRLIEKCKEAYDEIDKLKARLDELEGIAEHHLGVEDDSPYAVYWDKHYEDEPDIGAAVASVED